MIQLEAKGLTLAYGARLVLQDLDLQLSAGEVLGLIGPNGAGKTTLMRALAGLIAPRRGRVRLAGQDIARLDRRARARLLAWVPQRESAAWSLTVRQMVQLGRAPHRGWFLPYTSEDRRIVEEALQRTGLLPLQARTVDTLSGGEFQRVLLARALAQKPRVLLLDEPTASLDVHHQIDILDRVQELAAGEGLAVVMAIHDLNLAARYCSRLLLLHEGRVWGSGPPHQVLTPDNLHAVFGVRARLYRDPWGQWAVSVQKNGFLPERSVP